MRQDYKYTSAPGFMPFYIRIFFILTNLLTWEKCVPSFNRSICGRIRLIKLAVNSFSVNVYKAEKRF